jgi:hypothetical protein
MMSATERDCILRLKILAAVLAAVLWNHDAVA